MSLIAWLESLPEARLYSIIEDLLRSMKYDRVECVHGSGEIGKDIVFMESTPIHRPVWRAVQAKVMLSGNVRDEKNALAAILQCEAALRNPHQTSQGPVAIEQVWLVLSHALPDTAKRYIQSTLDAKASRILVIDGPELASLLAEYLPDVDQPAYHMTSYIRELSGFCDSPDEFLATFFKTKFNLSTVFVSPNCCISLMDQTSLEGTAVKGGRKLDQRGGAKPDQRKYLKKVC